MPVIINDFEIVTAPPPSPGRDQPPAQQQQPAPPPLRPEDIERIQRRQRLRLARLWAD
jgi:hypothetical protein